MLVTPGSERFIEEVYYSYLIYFTFFLVLVTYPLDVVRRRMQMKGISGDLFAYNSTKHAFTTIVQVEGIRGLYKGMWPNLLKVTTRCHHPGGGGLPYKNEGGARHTF